MTPDLTLAPNVVPAELGLTVRCSWCGRTLHAGAPGAAVTHGICVPCAGRWKADSARRVIAAHGSAACPAGDSCVPEDGCEDKARDHEVLTAFVPEGEE